MRWQSRRKPSCRGAARLADNEHIGEAVPSGNFSVPCCLTQNARRSGTIIKMPSTPPSTETTIMRVHSISNPRIITAGIVMPTPKAIDSPADPVVWTMLFSRIVARRKPKARENARKSVIAKTATGIEAETVIPTFITR